MEKIQNSLRECEDVRAVRETLTANARVMIKSKRKLGSSQESEVNRLSTISLNEAEIARI